MRSDYALRTKIKLRRSPSMSCCWARTSCSLALSRAGKCLASSVNVLGNVLAGHSDRHIRVTKVAVRTSTNFS